MPLRKREIRIFAEPAKIARTDNWTGRRALSSSFSGFKIGKIESNLAEASPFFKKKSKHNDQFLGNLSTIGSASPTNLSCTAYKRKWNSFWEKAFSNIRLKGLDVGIEI